MAKNEHVHCHEVEIAIRIACAEAIDRVHKELMTRDIPEGELICGFLSATRSLHAANLAALSEAIPIEGAFAHVLTGQLQQLADEVASLIRQASTPEGRKAMGLEPAEPSTQPVDPGHH